MYYDLVNHIYKCTQLGYVHTNEVYAYKDTYLQQKFYLYTCEQMCTNVDKIVMLQKMNIELDGKRQILQNTKLILRNTLSKVFEIE